MNAATTHANENEVTILARILGNENGQLPTDSPATSSITKSASGTRPGCTTWPCGIRMTH